MGFKKNNISALVDDSHCMGCSLCADVCRHGAVGMSLNADGYLRATVDADRCTDCGLCVKLCPALNGDRGETSGRPRAYYAWHANVAELHRSSSGGIAYVLGRMFVERGAVVYGCKWDNGRVVFARAETMDALETFRGSKYLQPMAAGIYKDVRSAIRSGREVLFVGLPCHVRALRNYVASDRLVTVDVLCAGVPSRLLFDGYCRWGFAGKRVTSVDFRAKDNGWRNSTIKVYSGNRQLLAEGRHLNRLFLGFNSGLLYNAACYGCHLNTLPRQGDISLGDYWRAPAGRDNTYGCSLVLANTSRGQELVSALHRHGVVCHEIALADALAGNCRMDSDHRDMPAERADALRLLRQSGFKKASDRYFRPPSVSGQMLGRLRSMVAAVLARLCRRCGKQTGLMSR